MKETNRLVCRECGKQQTRARARANKARCTSKTCDKPICLFCGCTESAACFVSQRQLLSPAPDYCYFIAPGICSNPVCIKRAYHAITPEEVRRAQAYYEENPPYTRRMPKPTLDDLRLGVNVSESDLAHIIINELLCEDHAYALSSQDVDIFDLIAGNYSGEISSIVAEMFAEWNSLVGRELFVSGENLLTATAEGIYG